MPRKENYVVIPFEEWNAVNHTIGDTKLSKYNFKRSPIHYNGLRFFIKTPVMFCRFGAEQPPLRPGEKRDTPHSQQWSIKLECEKDDLFIKKSQEFDQFMIDQGVKKSPELMGSSRLKPYPRTIVENKYTPMFRFVDSANEIPTHPPRLKLIFPQVTLQSSGKTEFRSEFYDEHDQLIDHVTPETITKNVPARCSCLASIYGVVISNVIGYRMTWYIHQIKIFQPALDWPEKGICLLGENKKNDIENPTQLMKMDKCDVIEEDIDTDVDEDECEKKFNKKFMH